MALDFFKVFSRGTFAKRNDPAAVIVVRAAADQKVRRNLAPRIKLIATQLRAVGLEDIVWTIIGEGRKPEIDVAPVRFLELKKLKGFVADRPAVFVGEDQYHVATEWISDLLSRAQNENQIFFPEGYRDDPPNQVCHQRLRGSFVVSPASLSADIAGLMANGYFSSWNHELTFANFQFPWRQVDVTPANMTTIYRQCVTYDRPINFIVELNSTCNYACLMCPYHGGRQKRSPYFLGPSKATEMPIERYKEVIDEIAALDRPYEDEDLSIRITPYRRGELLYHPHWREALAHIKKKGFNLYFSTNGSLWTEDDIRFVVDIGVDLIQVSINGYGVDTHKRLRLNDEYEQVAGVAKTLVRIRNEMGRDLPKVQANNILNEHTVEEMPTYLDYWLPRVDQIFVSPESYSDENGNKVYTRHFKGLPPPDISLRPACSMLKDYFVIDADGTGILCIGAKKVATGNVHELGVQGLLDSPVRQDIIAKHAAGDYNNPTCKTCGNWHSQTFYQREETSEYSIHRGPTILTYSRKGPPIISETVPLVPNAKHHHS